MADYLFFKLYNITVMKRVFQLSFLFVCIACLSFVEKKSNENRVMVYGIVYTTQCNSNSYFAYEYKLVEDREVAQAKTDMENYFEQTYPNRKFRIGTSSFDYGPSATNVCIYTWEKKEYNGCTYTVMAFQFGKTETEAYERAVKNKNTWGGENARMRIVEQKYW